MSNSNKPPIKDAHVDADKLSDRIRYSPNFQDAFKAGARLRGSSPVSSLSTGHTGGGISTLTSSSSSSSGSGSGRSSASDSGPATHTGAVVVTRTSSSSFGSGSGRSSDSLTSEPVGPTVATTSQPNLGGGIPTGTNRSSNFSGSGSGQSAAARRSGSGPTSCKSGYKSSSSASPRPSSFSGQSSGTSSASSASKIVLPVYGNICPSGNIKTAMMIDRSTTNNTLHSWSGYMGFGTIRCSAGTVAKTEEGTRAGVVGLDRAKDPEKVQRAGNEQYTRGNFLEALRLYDRACALSPKNAAYRNNMAEALVGLGKLGDALRACEAALHIHASYAKAHYLLGCLFIRLGQVDYARKHLCLLKLQPDASELRMLKLVENHLKKCTDARHAGDWKSVLREVDSAIAAGADFSPHLSMCRAEAYLKLHQIDVAESVVSNLPDLDTYTNSSQFFGMRSEAYNFFVLSQLEMASGRFESAVTNAKKAGEVDTRNLEITSLLQNMRMVVRARTRGNDLFKAERFTEASIAYAEGLRHDPSNSVLYCNRAACWSNIKMWEKCIEDCNHALRFNPKYIKALHRRAESHSKLERWAEAIKDYEVLIREFPDDKGVAESLFHAQVAFRKSRGEKVQNMNFGGEVEGLSTLEQFRAAICLPGVSVVYFKVASDLQCQKISPFLDTLCAGYPSINFLTVDIGETPIVAEIENVKIVPTFKIYKKATWVKVMVCPSQDMLEHSVRHYSS